MLAIVLVCLNVVLVGAATYVLIRRQSRFTPEWQKAVWFWLLVLALYAVQAVWGLVQYQVGAGVQFLNLILSILLFLAAYLGSETVMLAVKTEDTYLDAFLHLFSQIKSWLGRALSGLKTQAKEKD